jgi:hypothetical protein
MREYLHSPNTPSWCGAKLKKHGDFTFTLHSQNIWITRVNKCGIGLIYHSTQTF